MADERTGPIHRMVQRYADERPLRFHMPGHKGLGALPGASHDVTEVGGTDTLFDPTEGILEAQREAAACWGAAESRLLVGGSTAGLQAMALWAAAQGRQIYMGRDCHVSAVFACALAGLQPHWLSGRWHEEEQVAAWNTDSLRQLPGGAKLALLLTTPDYFGRCIDLAAVRRELQGRDVALLVDSAHGSHFAFSDRLPPDCGEHADLWVSGAHKTLPAPTQTAFLHIKRAQDAPLVTRLLQSVTTTSPSYVLMEGLDNARAHMAASAAELEDLIDRCHNLKARINRLDGLRAWDEGTARAQGYAALDPTRLVVDVRGLGMTGWQAAAALRRLSVVVEMVDHRRVVCILTIMDDEPRTAALLRALESLSTQRPPGAADLPQAQPSPPAGEAVMTLRQAWLSESVEAPLEQAAGRIAAEPFGAYPPGQALAMPGERIGEAAVAAALQALAMGGSVFGARRGMLSVVKE